MHGRWRCEFCVVPSCCKVWKYSNRIHQFEPFDQYRLVENQPIELKFEKSCLQYQIAKGIANSTDSLTLSNGSKNGRQRTRGGLNTATFGVDKGSSMAIRRSSTSTIVAYAENSWSLEVWTACSSSVERCGPLIKAACESASPPFSSQNCVELALLSQDKCNIVDIFVENILQDIKKRKLGELYRSYLFLK